MLFLLIIFLGILAALGWLLSASETAITSASRIKLHNLKRLNSARAKLALKLQENMGNVIATILLLNTFVLTAFTALVTTFITLVAGPQGAFYAAGIVAAFITIYLEVLPKILAFGQAERFALAFAPLIHFLKRLLAPATRLVDRIAHGSLRLFGVKINTAQNTAGQLEELKGAIDLYAGSKLAVNEKLMLKSVLDLTRATVSEAMVHRKKMVAFDATMPTPKLISKILSSSYSRIPLWRDNPDNVVGILHIKELSRALDKKQTLESTDIESLTQAPWFIPETTTLIAQLHAFRRKRSHFALVVDEYGSLLGFITLEDILEEIVGDIFDEHDEETSGIRELGSGRYLIGGDTTIRDLNRFYHWDLPSDEASTLAGLLLEIAEEIPKEKQIFRLNNLEFKIVKRVNNEIKLVEVRVHPKSEES
jgi:Mg2+/Co2+ transporter CorB